MSLPDTAARPLPSNVGVEERLLSSVFIDPELAWPEVLALPSEAFHSQAGRHLRDTMADLHATGKPVDDYGLILGRAEELGFSTWVNMNYLTGVAAQEATGAYAPQYALTLGELLGRRQAIRRATDLIRHATEGDMALEDLATLASQIALPLEPQGAATESISQETAIAQALEIIGRGPVEAIGTGLRDLDAEIVGLEPGALYVLAARPAMGKTAMGYQWMQNAARSGKRAVVCSLEMDAKQLALRSLATAARVDMQKVRTGALNERDHLRLAKAAPALAALPIEYFDSSDQTGTGIARRARRLHAAGKCDVLFLDYLQLVEADSTSGRSGMNRTLEVSAISRNLKKLARELNIPIVVLSQLSRAVEQRPNHRPVLSDLRESGAVEQDADTVMFIYRDEYYDPNTADQGVAEIIIGKQRNGPVGTVKVSYNSQFVMFADLSYAQDGI